MLHEMSWTQFVMWQRYYSLEPFGEERDDLRAGVIASTMANIHRDRDKHPEAFQAAEFVLKYGEPPAKPKPSIHTAEGWAARNSEFRDRLAELGVHGRSANSLPEADVHMPVSISGERR